MSYSHQDRKIGEDITRGLEKLGFECFLAHKDIPAGKWREILDRNLETFDVFLPLLTENARKSAWVHQESGIAHYRKRNDSNISIIPLKIDYDPEGCLSEYQAHKMKIGFMGKIKYGAKEILGLAKKFVEETNRRGDCKLASLSRLIHSDSNQAEMIIDFVSWAGMTSDDVEYILQCARQNGELFSSKVREKIWRYCIHYKEAIFKDQKSKRNMIWFDRTARKYKEKEQKEYHEQMRRFGEAMNGLKKIQQNNEKPTEVSTTVTPKTQID